MSAPSCLTYPIMFELQSLSGTPLPESHSSPADVDYGRIRRPLRLVAVSGRAMAPLLHPGQQVFVQQAFVPQAFDQSFELRGQSPRAYGEKLMALNYRGRTIIRRLQ